MVILKRSKQINDTGHLLPKSRDSHYNFFLVLKMYHFKAIGLFINHYHHYCFVQRFHIGIAQQIYALGVREKLEKEFFFLISETRNLDNQQFRFYSSVTLAPNTFLSTRNPVPWILLSTSFLSKKSFINLILYLVAKVIVYGLGWPTFLIFQALLVILYRGHIFS